MLSLIWIGSIMACVYLAFLKNRSWLGFFFIGFFLGPLGVVIALLVSPQTKDMPLGDIHSLPQARLELASLKKTLTSFQERVAQLEEKLETLDQKTPSTVEVLPAAGDVGAQTPVVHPQDFEYTFGKYWLNRVGVVVFVIGIALFISYSIKNMPAYFKIFIGYVLAGGFFTWGRYLEKQEKFIKLAWGISGGAWGLLYLSTYALHFIPATCLITNPFVALTLLSGVSLAAVIYNLRYRSWVVTAITFLLAFFTAGLGGLDYPMVAYWTLLTGSIAFIAVRQRWERFLVFAIAGCYLTYFGFLENFRFLAPPVIFLYSLPVDIFQLRMALLLISWVIFTKTLLYIEGKGLDVRFLVTGDLLNAAFMTAYGLHNIYYVRSNLDLAWDPRFGFLSAFAGAYLLLAFMFKLSNKPQRIPAAVSTAFTLFAIAVLIKFPRLSIGYFWVAEAMVLFVLGIYYRIVSYRMLAVLLFLMVLMRLFIVDLASAKRYFLFGMAFKHNILIFLSAALSYFGSAILAKQATADHRLEREEGPLYNFFPAVGAFVLVALLHEEVSARWLTLSWALTASLILGMGLGMEHKSFRLAGLGVLVLAFSRLIFIDLNGINTIYKIVAFISLGAVFLILSFVYSNRLGKKE